MNRINGIEYENVTPGHHLSLSLSSSPPTPPHPPPPKKITQIINNNAIGRVYIPI